MILCINFNIVRSISFISYYVYNAKKENHKHLTNVDVLKTKIKFQEFKMET
jgi:hypothetical protein